MEAPSSEGVDSSRFDKLEWIALNNAMSGSVPAQEGVREKLVRKIKENPFVPIGALLTSGALGYGLWSMKSGNAQRSQFMMRFRVIAQGFTIAAIVVGMAIGATKKS